MAAAAEATDNTISPPDKDSPSDRLVRKRAAARLRQQRCRARKRQAMLEERRLHGGLPPSQRQQRRQDSRELPPPDYSSSMHYAVHRPVLCMRGRAVEGDSLSDSSSASSPIQNVVSFESQRSSEENRSFERMQQPTESAPKKIMSPNHRFLSTATVSPSGRPPLEVVSLPKDTPKEILVPEEEAAVAAMLSLKTGPQKKKEYQASRTLSRDQSHLSRNVIKIPHATKYRYTRAWDVRPVIRYEYARPMRTAEYHSMRRPAPTQPSPYHYGYYHHYERYERYPRYEC